MKNILLTLIFFSFASVLLAGDTFKAVSTGERLDKPLDTDLKFADEYIIVDLGEEKEALQYETLCEPKYVCQGNVLQLS